MPITGNWISPPFFLKSLSSLCQRYILTSCILSLPLFVQHKLKQEHRNPLWGLEIVKALLDHLFQSRSLSIAQFSLAGKLPSHMFAIKVSVPHRLMASSLFHLGHVSEGNSPRLDLQAIFGGSSDTGISHNGIHVNYEFIHSFFCPGLPLKFQRSPSEMQFDPFWNRESSLVTPFETN